MSKVHRLWKQLSVAEDREEKAISKDFEDLRCLSSTGVDALSAPSSCLLVPEESPEELENVFQMPIPS